MSVDPLTAESGYLKEVLAAFDRTEDLAIQAPPRVLVQKDCVDGDLTRTVLLDYFCRH